MTTVLSTIARRCRAQQLRRWRRAGCVLSGLLLLIVAVASATQATAALRPGPAGPALTVEAPAPGSVIATAGLAAARAVRTEASIRVADGVHLVSVRLNGKLVPVREASGVVHAELAASDGLRPGVNRLRVEATRPGAKVPLNAVSQFAVTYPDAALVTLSLNPGQGEGALVSPVLRVPASGLSTLSVSLNGSDVTALLGPATAGGDRPLELSAAEPLHWGSNTLTVLASMDDGRTQTVTRSFDVDSHRDIAGVRLVSPAHVGQAAVLDAGSSRLVGGPGPSTVRWALVRKPARSRIAISAEGSRESFVPDAPGRYVVRVTAGAGADAGSATMTVTATYAGLLVPVNSIDGGSPSALAIGSDRFVVSGGLQVNVFDRASLEWLSSQGFDTSSSGITAMGSYLKALPDTDLVFVTHPSTSPGVAYSDIAALNTALGYVGGSYPRYWTMNMPNCWAGNTSYCYTNDSGWQPGCCGIPPAGSFSIAGVPGMQAGNAWRATAVQQQSSEGRITGYLSRGVPAQTGGAESYVIVAGADQFAPVDTCASGGPTQCVIRVGSQTFAPTPGANGFNIVTLDRTTLTPIWHGTVTTVGGLFSALQYLKSPLPGKQLAPPVFVDDQRVIVIQSVGTGILPASTSDPYPYLDYFGITPELFKAAMTDGTPYAAVGVANNLPWHGTATESSPLAGKQQTGRLRTVLSLNRDWLYTPTAGDPYGQTNLDMYSIMYQNPTPWSWVGDPAVAYIGTSLNLPSDVRSAYTNGNVDFASKAALLANLTCTDPTACGPNFDAVKKQLLNEFDWVEGTRALISNLEYPFVVSQGSQPVDVQDVYNEISATIKPPPQANTSFGFLNMFVDVTNLAAAIATATGQDDAGAALGLLSAAGEFATEFTPTPDGDSSDTLTGIVDNLDEQLADMQISYIEALDQLQAILVTDAGKLQAVGVAVGTNPAWNWSQGTSLSESITALNATSRSASYSALLPPTWAMWDLKPDDKTQYSSDDVTTYECSNDSYPPIPVPVWSNALPANQLHAVTSVNSQQAAVSEVWTFSNIDTGSFSAGPVNAVNVPDQSLTDNLTSTNTLTGAFQYLPQWIRTTYNPPGHTVCSASDVYPSIAKVPPVIPNADAAKNQ